MGSAVPQVGELDNAVSDDSDLELLGRWKGGEKTWEPYENVVETEVLDKYERHHGQRPASS